MRYTLRNQSLIILRYDHEFLDRLTKSLDEEFKLENHDIITVEHEPFPMLSINDVTHTCGLIIFYIIEQKFDVYKLAFKEIIN